jgi:hypothetical protein
MDWGDVDHVGIRLGESTQPSEELFALGQKAVIYDPHCGTVPAFGEFVAPPARHIGRRPGGQWNAASVYTLPAEEHGCLIAAGFRVEGGIAYSRESPKLATVLRGAGKLRRNQLVRFSYRGLTWDEYEQLVAAIKAHKDYKPIYTPRR